jgi:predicted hotdog family 3-hydroxylacyl-ACP dehydratase
MALHGSLVAPSGDAPRPGYLASVRQVRLSVATLHDVPGELQVRATRLAGDARQILYQFSVGDDGGRVLAEGRATVVLNALPESS